MASEDNKSLYGCDKDHIIQNICLFFSFLVSTFLLSSFRSELKGDLVVYKKKVFSKSFPGGNGEEGVGLYTLEGLYDIKYYLH